MDLHTIVLLIPAGIAGGTISASDVIPGDVVVKLVPVGELEAGAVERGEIHVRTPYMIDGYFGALSAVASWSLPPRVGMLVRIEKSETGGRRRTSGRQLTTTPPR